MPDVLGEIVPDVGAWILGLTLYPQSCPAPLLCLTMLLCLCEDVPLVEFVYLVFIACQVRVTAGSLRLCCCVCVMSFECQKNPLSVDFVFV